MRKEQEERTKCFASRNQFVASIQSEAFVPSTFLSLQSINKFQEQNVSVYSFSSQNDKANVAILSILAL